MKNLGPADVAPATSAGPCSDCGTLTSSPLRVCRDCSLDRTRRACADQGVAFKATDDPRVSAWLARLFTRRSAA